MLKLIFVYLLMFAAGPGLRRMLSAILKWILETMVLSSARAHILSLTGPYSKAEKYENKKFLLVLNDLPLSI